jgi:hypothetical protein
MTERVSIVRGIGNAKTIANLHQHVRSIGLGGEIGGDEKGNQQGNGDKVPESFHQFSSQSGRDSH